MEPYVRTRWTEDGLVEIWIDAGTAQYVLEDLGTASGARTAKLFESLGHTLQSPNKPPSLKGKTTP